jgi:hypothetical protein
MNGIWTAFKNKFGRLVTASGGLLALADLDVSPIRENLEGFLSHKMVQGVTAALFLASFLRHHWVAQQNPKP